MALTISAQTRLRVRNRKFPYLYWPSSCTKLNARLGIVYPRGATVGGSTQVNAMNLGPPPDHEVSNGSLGLLSLLLQEKNGETE
jgi:hypothetical protein